MNQCILLTNLLFLLGPILLIVERLLRTLRTWKTPWVSAAPPSNWGVQPGQDMLGLDGTLRPDRAETGNLGTTG